MKKKKNRLIKKFIALFIFTLTLTTSSYAAKWQTLVFNEDINMGLAELDRYCMLHDISVADVLWANSITSSGDIKSGTSIYLPANQADMLAIWQNQGAWKPTALVPVNSAVHAKKIAVEHEKKLEAKKKKEPVQLFQNDTKIKNNEENAELQTKLEDLMKEAEAPKTEAAAPPVASVANVNVVEEKKINVPKNSDPFPEIYREMKIEPSRPQTPQAAIAQMAKPDAILTPKPKKTQPAAMKTPNDPIIVLSPNGNSAQGPMKLLIVGDKVEVVKIPENAVPKTPTMADLDHVFGTTPDYVPYYNMTSRPRDDNFMFNFSSLNGKMMWPVDGKVSSYFGPRGKRMHEGVDIPMPAGTPIRAAKNGVVSRTGDNSTMGFRGYGNFVLLDHGGGVQSFYAHCSSVAVRQGQRIMQGQIIGYVGSTGRSTANHLHFEVRVNDKKVDPMPYLGGNTRLASKKK